MPVVIYPGLRSVELSPNPCVSISIWIILVQVMFRQPCCWDFMAVPFLIFLGHTISQKTFCRWKYWWCILEYVSNTKFIYNWICSNFNKVLNDVVLFDMVCSVLAPETPFFLSIGFIRVGTLHALCDHLSSLKKKCILKSYQCNRWHSLLQVLCHQVSWCCPLLFL